MTLDPATERVRVEQRYASAGPRALVAYAVLLLVAALGWVWRGSSPFFVLGALAAAALWEVTKYRLRRNARWLASGRH
ncbi:hypothetical protein [Nocardioides abyssi]|uniref:Uncharacterized protein n=1 Tax=Nocardioides abyssi TaxID=3058370 RepID=A0ABT8ET43_9ACTN|nr:hypothetical protein [Nocardioides abyssi]MDN4161091.1 hypothetical protein [Nocardioides abyssi]